MNVLRRFSLFLTRCRRLVLFTTTLLCETLFLALSVRRKPEAERAAYRCVRQSLACARAVRRIGIDVRVSGPVPVDSGSLIVSNHLGTIDPFVIGSRFQLVFSAKAEMMEWPVAGWVCRSIGLIPVYRGRRTRAVSFAEEVAARLRDGLNVLAFPEGTTSGGTDVLPFKTGAFAAVELLGDGRILPLTLRVVEIDGHPPDADGHSLFTWAGGDQSMAAHVWGILGVRSATFEIVVSPAIAASGSSRKQLADTCYELIRQTSVSQRIAV